MPALTTLYCPSCNNPISPGTKFCASCGHQLETSDEEARDPLVGQIIHKRYRVEAKLGEGGMGAVYQAEQVAMKRKVALKVLHPHLSQDAQLIERFNREAAASSRLNHPNTITVHDFGATDDGTLFIVMEFVEGQNLADYVESSGAMPWQRAVHVCLQVAESLADAHEQGIVHRDLKPDNIMLIERAGQNDFVKILDFGIAKMAESTEDGDKRKALTKTGMIFGTPQYMSPEQIRGSGVDHRTDIYALGVILYQLITGDLPFYAENPMGMLTKHLMEPPRPMAQTLPGLQIPSQLESLVFKCLEKDQNLRYQSMNEIVRELGSMANETRPGFAVNAPPPASDAGGSLTSSPGAFGAAPTGGGDPFARQPTGGFTGQPPSGGFAGQPPSGGFVGQPPSGGFVGQPSTGGFAGQPSTGGVTPGPAVTSERPRTGRTVGVILAVVLVLGGLGVGAAFVWNALSDDGDDGGEAVTTTDPPPVEPPPVEPPPVEPPPVNTSSVEPPPVNVPPVSSSANPPISTATVGDLSKATPCKVTAAGGEKASKASQDLAKAFEARGNQLGLCFAPVLSKSFDGGMKISYSWGRRGKGPSKIKASDDTIDNEQVFGCLKTAIQMVTHPESKSGSAAILEVKAAGGGGALKTCTIEARVPQRRSNRGPKPPGWVPTPGYYPPYGGYQGY